MANHKRRFSDASIDSDVANSCEVTYLAEKGVLKRAQAKSDPDDWPCYLLEDAVVYAQDGVKIENMLHSELDGPFIVRGRVVVDKQYRKHLINRSLQNVHIEIKEFHGFSISCGPIVLWASGSSGWFEIRPAPEYHTIYTEMMRAIGLYYFLTQFYENLQSRRKSYAQVPISKIFFLYSVHDGTGLVKAEVESIFASNAKFLLSQMGIETALSWPRTQVFHWLIQRAPDIYIELQKKRGLSTELPIMPKNFNIQEASVPLPLSKPVASAVRVEALLADSTAESSFPESESQEVQVIYAVVQIMNDYRASEEAYATKLTIAKVAHEFWRSYRVTKQTTVHEIVRIYAGKIFASLDRSWRRTAIYAAMRDLAMQPPRYGPSREEALNVKLIPRRHKAQARRLNIQGTAADSLDPGSVDDSLKLPRRPYAGKQTQEGRQSGKTARLRLSSALTRSSSEMATPIAIDTGSEDENQPPRKRKRNSQFNGDIGHASTSGGAVIDDEDEEDEEDEDEDDSDSEERSGLELTLVNETLPSLQPTGPNGTWVCEAQNCSFVVRNAESEEGERTIQDHFLKHAEKDARESLVRQEAAFRRLPIENLLSKLKSLGQASRLATSTSSASLPASSPAQQIINGKIVPQRIQRSIEL